MPQQAGLHLVLHLPDGTPDTWIAQAALAQGVTVRALSTYYSAPGGQNGLLFGYGMAEAGQIPALVERVSRALAASGG